MSIQKDVKFKMEKDIKLGDNLSPPFFIIIKE